MLLFRKPLFLFASLTTLVVAAIAEAQAVLPLESGRATVPNWAQEAVWYQVFLERFRNGDLSNDPQLADLEGAWPHLRPAGWQPTPWGQDWYRLEAWAQSRQDFYQTVYMRRYGGDLQGLIDRLDYLQDLGVTAIYLNPINDAPSLHKYDARNYRHIDRNFGPDPARDAKLMAAEDPADPETWQWTTADRLFLKLLELAHQRGMRVIIDYSWNHTGTTFWAFQDVRKRQANSPFRDWYRINAFDDPDTTEDEFAYRGWHGVADLPELNRAVNQAGEEDLHPAVKRHVFAVTRRWLDPNGDGNCEDGVDGFRLDVAAEIPSAFWRDYRRFVKEINPEAFLVGEIWWEKWPVSLADPAPWLQGDMFDSVMDYRWYAAARGLFANAIPRETPTSFRNQLLLQSQGLSDDTQRGLMRLLSGHDSPRCMTSIENPGLYKYRTGLRGDSNYRIQRPGSEVRRTMKTMLLCQFTSVAAPQIYYGDEVGMWGADDPDNRKPMVWADIEYEDEASHPLGDQRTSDRVQPDLNLHAHVRQLAKMRKRHADLLVYGDFEVADANDEERWFVTRRWTDDKNVYVIFNLKPETRPYHLPNVDAAIDLLTEKKLTGHSKAKNLSIRVPGNSGIVVRVTEP